MGRWERVDKSESGVIRIRIDDVDGGHVRGVLEIEGTPYCKLPIAFSGTGEGKKMSVQSTETIVCGFPGTLTGVVEEGTDDYVGSFLYRFLGTTWVAGTFHVLPDVRK